MFTEVSDDMLISIKICEILTLCSDLRDESRGAGMSLSVSKDFWFNFVTQVSGSAVSVRLCGFCPALRFLLWACRSCSAQQNLSCYAGSVLLCGFCSGSKLFYKIISRQK